GETADLDQPRASSRLHVRVRSQRDVTRCKRRSPRLGQCLVDRMLGRRVIRGLLSSTGSSGAGKLRRAVMPECVAFCQTAVEVLEATGAVRRCPSPEGPGDLDGRT